MNSGKDLHHRISKGFRGEAEGTERSSGVTENVLRSAHERVSNTGEHRVSSRGYDPAGMGTIRGRVQTWGQEPMSEAMVAISGGPTHRDIAALTDEQGSFWLADLLPGVYEISAHAAGYPLQTKSVTVGADQSTTVDFQFGR
jgi:hypothetical protein